MTEFTSTDELLDLLCERNPRFDPRSYSFVLEALNSVFHSLGEKRHITGAELAEGVRQVAIERFGPLARTVLEHWGIHSTRDVGSVVFALVEQKILTTQDGDCPEDFADVFDFEEAFELNYPWEARI